jgi:hypothetical protein
MIALALAASLSEASCRRDSQKVAAPARTAVGWRTDLPGEPVRGGRLLTTPAGHEELLLPAVATAVRGWAKGCPSPRSASEPLAGFRLAISATGAVRTIEGPSDDPFGKCLIENGRRRAVVAAQPGVDLVIDLALDLGGRS